MNNSWIDGIVACAISRRENAKGSFGNEFLIFLGITITNRWSGGGHVNLPLSGVPMVGSRSRLERIASSLSAVSYYTTNWRITLDFDWFSKFIKMKIVRLVS